MEIEEGRETAGSLYAGAGSVGTVLFRQANASAPSSHQSRAPLTPNQKRFLSSPKTLPCAELCMPQAGFTGWF